MTIPPKYEDLVLKVAELERRESDLMEKIARAERVSFTFFDERDAALAREAELKTSLEAVTFNLDKTDKALLALQNSEAALREELSKYKLGVQRLGRTLEKVIAIARASKSSAIYLQQRLTVAEQLLREAQAAFNYNPEGSCYNPGISFIKPWSIKAIAALKPVA